jgi:hypothetical protein
MTNGDVLERYRMALETPTSLGVGFSDLLRDMAEVITKFNDALERIALLDEADGHELTAQHALEAVGIASSTLGKHPSVILVEREARKKSGG